MLVLEHSSKPTTETRYGTRLNLRETYAARAIHLLLLARPLVTPPCSINSIEDDLTNTRGRAPPPKLTGM